MATLWRMKDDDVMMVEVEGRMCSRRRDDDGRRGRDGEGTC